MLTHINCNKITVRAMPSIMKCFQSLHTFGQSKRLIFILCLFVTSFALGQNAGLVEFESSSHAVNEQASFKTVTVRRMGGSAGSLTLNYATVDGTALASTLVPVVTGDYIATSGTLIFGDGETEKVITVQICNDSTVEPSETFSLHLNAAELSWGPMQPRFSPSTILRLSVLWRRRLQRLAQQPLPSLSRLVTRRQRWGNFWFRP